MSGKISGVARIKIDGELTESMPGAELDIGGFKREMVAGHTVYGYTEKVMPSELTMKIVWKNGTPIETFRNLTAGLITFESDNGVTYQISNCVCLDPPKLTDDKGEISLKFGGDAAEAQ